MMKEQNNGIIYNYPNIKLLKNGDMISCSASDDASDERERIITETLQSLNYPCKVLSVTVGRAITRYELMTPLGTPIRRILEYSADLNLRLEKYGPVRIEVPIPGKRTVGVEVPNKFIDIVGLRDIIESDEFIDSESPLTLAIGKDMTDANIICRLEKMPHLLIAGITNSGKSSCLHSIILSILYKSSPEDVRLILVDPKRLEFQSYHGMPHLLGGEVIVDTSRAVNALAWAVNEMERRYYLLAKYQVRNITEFNECEAVKSGEESKLPRLVIIVDELAELMMFDRDNGRTVENKIVRLAQKARASGIHMIFATQRPSVDVITGIIKANMPSRIAFRTTSVIDSRTILDCSGAEALLSRGDMLFAPMFLADPIRVQGAYVTEEEVTAVVEYVKKNNKAKFNNEFIAAVNSEREDEYEPSVEEEKEKLDELMPEILKHVIEAGTASISMIQRRFSVGYARAARIVDQMEAKKFIGPIVEFCKPREVYITREQYEKLFGTGV